jgi:hypothetical protein
MVDCIDVKVDEGILAREMYSNESSTEDIAKADDEQVQESENKDSESDEDSYTQTDSNQQSTSNSSSRIIQKNHSASQIIGEKDKGVQTGRKLIKNTKQSHIAFIFKLEPKNFNESNKDDHWVKAMNDEKIEKNNTREMVVKYIFMLPFYSINYNFASISIHFAFISFHIFHKIAYARYIYHSLA